MFRIFAEPPPDCTATPSLDMRKLGLALRGAVGRTVAGAFLTRYAGERYRLHLAFTDGTHYEIYGTGMLSGARAIVAGDVDALRRVLTDDAALEVIEISPETQRR